MTGLKTSLLSLTLRGVTLVSKFLLILFMARFLTPEELGIYGLMNVTIMLCLYVAGMDFNAYNARELIARPVEEHAALVRDQFAFHGVVYIVFLPTLVVVFFAGSLPWKYVAWFYVLLILEHLSQEADRLFVTLSRPLMANFVLFFRLGAWGYVVIAVAFFVEEARDLTVVWAAWTAGVFTSLLIAAFGLRNLDWRRALRTPVDWPWVRRGLRTSLVLLAAAVSSKGTDYADRYFLQYFHGEAQVGVYTFYAQLANVVQTAMYAGVLMLYFPQLISAYQSGGRESLRAVKRRMRVNLMGGTALTAICVAIGVYPVMMIVDKQIYFEHLTAFWVFLGSVVVLLMGQLPHLELFVKKRDKAILGSSLVSLIVALIMNAALVPQYGILGAAIGTLIASLTLSGMKLGLNLAR